jgi:hypothetical protein
VSHIRYKHLQEPVGTQAMADHLPKYQITFPRSRTIIIIAVALATVCFVFLDNYNPRRGLLSAIQHGEIIGIPYRWILALCTVMIAYALIARRGEGT